MIDVNDLKRLDLGQRGENKATVIEIDVSSWRRLWPDASIGVQFVLPDSEFHYVPDATVNEDDVLVWTVGAYETSEPGIGLAIINATDTETGLMKRSKGIPTIVRDLPMWPLDDAEAPEPLKLWANRLMAYENKLQDAILDARASAQQIIDMANDLVQTEQLMVTDDGDGYVTLEGGYGTRTNYPVGSLYMTEGEEKPAALFGGDWVEVTGRFLLGATNAQKAGTTGGSSTFSLTVDNIPEAVIQDIENIKDQLIDPMGGE